MSKSNILLSRDYNFFSASLGVRSSSRNKILLLLIFLLVFACLVAGFYFSLEYIGTNTKNQIASHDEFLASQETREGLQAVQELKLFISQLTDYNSTFSTIITDLNALAIINSDYLKTITSTLPPNLYFQSVSMTNNQLQIQGVAPNRLSIAELLNNMQDLELFSNVHISNIVTLEEEYSFVLSCQLKDVEIR